MLQSCGDTGAGAVRVLVGAPSTRRTAGRRRIVEIPRLQVIHRTGQYCQDIDQPPFNSDGPASSITIAKGDQLLEPMNVPSFNGWFEYDGSSGRPRQAPAQRPDDHDRVRRFRAGVRQPVHCRTRSAEVIQRELESDGRNIQPDTEMGGRWDVQGGEMLRKREGERGRRWKGWDGRRAGARGGVGLRRSTWRRDRGAGGGRRQPALLCKQGAVMEHVIAGDRRRPQTSTSTLRTRHKRPSRAASSVLRFVCTSMGPCMCAVSVR